MWHMIGQDGQCGGLWHGLYLVYSRTGVTVELPPAVRGLLHQYQKERKT
jgi:hypothetical protein